MELVACAHWSKLHSPAPGQIRESREDGNHGYLAQAFTCSTYKLQKPFPFIGGISLKVSTTVARKVFIKTLRPRTLPYHIMSGLPRYLSVCLYLAVTDWLPLL